MNQKSTTSKMIFQSLFVKIQLDTSVWNWSCRKSVGGPGELKTSRHSTALQMKWTVVFKHACCNCLETLQTFEDLHDSVNQNVTSNERLIVQNWSLSTRSMGSRRQKDWSLLLPDFTSQTNPMKVPLANFCGLTFITITFLNEYTYYILKLVFII